MPSFLNLAICITVAAAGSLIVYSAYRRNVNRSTLNLRSEVLAEERSVRAAIDSLPEHMARARHCMTGAALAAGHGNDGLLQWLEEMDRDLSEAARLKAELSAAGADHLGLSEIEVELKLVEVLSLSLRVGALADKYDPARYPTAVDAADEEEAARGPISTADLEVSALELAAVE